MHEASVLRMKWFADNYANVMDGENLKILDVGSRNTKPNRQYKPLFDEEKFSYTGVDIESGPNVDMVLPAPYNWSSIETESYDIVISGQAFEHIEFIWVTISEMTRVLKKDGLLCIIAPLGFREHRYPVDCYRFFADGMIALARWCNLKIVHAHSNCAPSKSDDQWYSDKDADSMIIATKQYEGDAQHPDLSIYQCVPAKHLEFQGTLVKK